MEINVVDITDRWLLKEWVQLNEWKKIVIEMHPGPNGVARMVDAIVELAKCPGTITVLRIYAHGNSGVINIAAGKDPYGSDRLSGIDLENLPKLTPTLERLRPYFAPNARVELHGCFVAKGSDGEKLMLKLAKLWNARIQASPMDLPIGAVNFQGPAYEANQSGGLSCAVATDLTRN
jgi:Domain of unknown function (DUF4347)